MMGEWKPFEPKQPASACVKIAYTSRRRASGAVRVTAKRNQRTDDWSLMPYKCKLCRSWHIGHDRFAVKES